MHGLRSHAGTVAGHLLDLALPATCAGCGREGEPLCADCRPAIHARGGMSAGIPLGLPSDIPAPLLQLEWCAPFDGIVRRALHALKYAGELRLVEPLGGALAARWRQAGAGGDCLVHVPVHSSRAAGRGFDQAERLARAAAAELGLPHVHALERVRATTAQFQLDRRHRAANVADAFRLRPGRTSAASVGAMGRGSRGAGRLPGIDGRWVVLIDDVVTTGATLSACAAVLLRGGVIGVSALTVARER
jgi:predicted amidophosphoribosyltransferase